MQRVVAKRSCSARGRTSPVGRGFTRMLLGLLLMGLVACQAASEPAPDASAPDSGTAAASRVRLGRVVETRTGAVACVERHAARIGAEVLARGGHAADAVVAMAFALAVTWPPAGGLGGGGMLVVAPADGAPVVVDFREMAPAAVDAEHFLDDQGRLDPNVAADPWRAGGIPGVVAGMGLLHTHLGRLEWSELVRPALLLAENGFVVDETLARWLAAFHDDLAQVPSTAAVFLDTGDRTPIAGTRLIQSDLAAVLQVLADRGAEAFYDGPLARRFTRSLRQVGGLITAGDMRRYKAKVRKPLRLPLLDHEVLAPPPPSSGGVALGQIFGQASRVGALGGAPDAPATVHLLAEASRRAFADRAQWLGDPDHVEVPVERMLSDEHLDLLAGSIVPHAATPSHTLGPPVQITEGQDTTHLSVVDAEGNAISCTLTLESAFGGKGVVPGTGILLNNQLGDFNREPGRSTDTGAIGTLANQAAPGKRPLTSMTPVIVLLDGRPRLVTGSPGGRTIINTVAQVVLRVVAHGADPAQAVAAPRWHHQWYPDAVVLEADAWPDALGEGLAARGHTVNARGSGEPLHGTQGCANTVAVDPVTGLRTAVGDGRRDGWAAVTLPPDGD